jgi:hypothetical protein
MLTYKTGHKVGKGTYWDLASGQRVDVATEAVLSGGRNATFVKMSGLMLLTVPLMGLIYAILMPFMGIATVAVAGAGIIASGMYNIAVKSVSFGWRPKNAYLSGKKKSDESKK